MYGIERRVSCCEYMSVSPIYVCNSHAFWSKMEPDSSVITIAHGLFNRRCTKRGDLWRHVDDVDDARGEAYWKNLVNLD